MTTMSANSAQRFAYRYRNPIVECGGARMRAQIRQLATVVTICGDIDATNLDEVRRYAARYVLSEKPFVLDLSEVHTFAAEAVSLLWAVEHACDDAGVEWKVIASQPVQRALGEHTSYDFADTIPEALNHFLDSILARRRLLPLLHQTA